MSSVGLVVYKAQSLVVSFQSGEMARVGIVLPLFALLLSLRRATVGSKNVTTVLSFADLKNGLDLLTAETERPSVLSIDDYDKDYVITTKTATVTVNYYEDEENEEDDDDAEADASGIIIDKWSDRIDTSNNASDFACSRLTNNLAIEIRFVTAISLIFTAVGFVVLCGAIYFLARPVLRSRREYDLRRATYVRLSDIGKSDERVRFFLPNYAVSRFLQINHRNITATFIARPILYKK